MHAKTGALKKKLSEKKIATITVFYFGIIPENNIEFTSAEGENSLNRVFSVNFCDDEYYGFRKDIIEVFCE